jgi:hypothetical protein
VGPNGLDEFLISGCVQCTRDGLADRRNADAETRGRETFSSNPLGLSGEGEGEKGRRSLTLVAVVRQRHWLGGSNAELRVLVASLLFMLAASRFIRFDGFCFSFDLQDLCVGSS